MTGQTPTDIRRGAVERLLAQRPDDCADLCLRYLRLLGRPVVRPGPPLEAAVVTRALDVRPSRRALYGDIAMFRRRPDPDAALGIHLGYCVLTAAHGAPTDGSALARIPIPRALLAWSV